MSWVTIVVIIVGCLLALFATFLVWACCRMSSLTNNEAPYEWTDERIANKLEDIAYSDEKNLSGIALNALLNTAKYYRAPKEKHEDKIPLMCNIRTHVRGYVKQLPEEMCSRYILMRGAMQDEIDETKYGIPDIAVVVVMREIRKALEGEFPASMVK